MYSSWRSRPAKVSMTVLSVCGGGITELFPKPLNRPVELFGRWPCVSPLGQRLGSLSEEELAKPSVGVMLFELARRRFAEQHQRLRFDVQLATNPLIRRLDVVAVGHVSIRPQHTAIDR